MMLREIFEELNYNSNDSIDKNYSNINDTDDDFLTEP